MIAAILSVTETCKRLRINLCNTSHDVRPQAPRPAHHRRRRSFPTELEVLRVGSPDLHYPPPLRRRHFISIVALPRIRSNCAGLARREVSPGESAKRQSQFRAP